MAFADLGSLGATGNTGNNQNSLALTTAAVCAIGELVVIVVADDNRLSTADADGSEVSGVVDSSGVNVWQKAIGWANNRSSAQAGAAVQIWYTYTTAQIANGGTITASFTDSGASDATAMTARHFSGTGGIIVATNTLSNNAADPGSLDAVTANIACLRIRGIASEVGNNTNLTATGGGWTAWANGNSATTGTTGEMCARAEHLISTGTGAASDPTYVSADTASAYVAFREKSTTAQAANITQGQTVTLRSNVRKRLALTLGQTVSIIKTVSKLFRTQRTWAWAGISGSPISGLAISGIKFLQGSMSLTAVATFVPFSGPQATAKIINVIQAQTVTVFKTVAKLITLSHALVASLTRVKLKIQLVTLSHSLIVSLRVVVSKLVSITQAQAITLVRAIAKLVTVTIGQTVRVLKTYIAPVVSVTQGQIVTLRRTTNKLIVLSHSLVASLVRVLAKLSIIAITQAQAITLTRNIAKIITTITQAQTVRAIKAVAKPITLLAQEQVVSLFRTTKKLIVLSHSLLALVTAILAKVSIISITQGQVVTLRRNIAKLITITQAQSLIVRKAVAKLITLTQDQVVSLTRTTRKLITVSALSVVASLSAILAKVRNISVTQGQTVLLRRTAAKRAAITQGQTVTLRRTTGKLVAILQDQSLRVLRAIRVRIVLTLGQSITRTASVARRIVITGLGQTVRLLTTRPKRILVSIGQTVTSARSLATAARTAIIEVVQGQSVTLLRGLSKLIAYSRSIFVRCLAFFADIPGSGAHRRPGWPKPNYGGKPAKSFRPVWDEVHAERIAKRQAELDARKRAPAPFPPSGMFAPRTGPAAPPLPPNFVQYAPADPMGIERRLRDAADLTDIQDVADAIGLSQEEQDLKDALDVMQSIGLIVPSK